MTVWYMNGAGNDFAVTDARGKNIDMSSMAVELCKKESCDGFMALDCSDIADFKLHFYNRDGSRAEMCGNGARCICRFAYENGIVSDKMTVETDAGIVGGQRIGENVYQVRLNSPKDIILNKKDSVDYAVVGVPHATVELETLDFYKTEELLKIGQRIRNELDANVNFYERVDEMTVKILTYERGVEDFTLACGTGSCAVASVLWSRGLLNKGKLILQNRGGELMVSVMTDVGEITEIYLQGNAEINRIYEW